MDPVIHRPVKHNYYIYWYNFSKTCKTYKILNFDINYEHVS